MIILIIYDDSWSSPYFPYLEEISPSVKGCAGQCFIYNYSCVQIFSLTAFNRIANFETYVIANYAC